MEVSVLPQRSEHCGDDGTTSNDCTPGMASKARDGASNLIIRQYSVSQSSRPRYPLYIVQSWFLVIQNVGPVTYRSVRLSPSDDGCRKILSLRHALVVEFDPFIQDSGF